MQWFLNHTLYYTHYIKCFANWVYRSIPAGIRTGFAGLAKALEQHKCGHAPFLIALVVHKLYFIYSYDNIVWRLQYALFQKKFQIKVFRHQISDKEVCERHMSTFPHRSGARGSKNDIV